MPAELLNAEAIVGSYLRDHADVKALGARVVGEPPGDGERDTLWVQIVQQDASNRTRINRVEHLVAYWLQLDCYAGASGGQAEARSLMATVRAALVTLPSATLEDAVVTDVEILSNPRIPDRDMEPARQRYIIDAEVYAHAK